MAIDFSQIINCADNDARMIISDPKRNIIGYGTITETPNYFSSDYIYFGNVSCLPKEVSLIINTNLVLLLDAELPQFLSECNTINLILVEDVDSFKLIKKGVKQVFEGQIKINNYAYGLLNLYQSSSTIEQMLNYAYYSIGNPIMIVDSSLFLLNQVGMDSVNDEPMIDFTLKNGYLPDEYLTEVLSHEDNISTVQSDLIVRRTKLSKHRLFAFRVIRNNHLLGYIKVVEENRPVTKLEESYMIILSKYLSISISDSALGNFFNNSLADSFLIGLLDKKIIVPLKIEERANVLKLNFSGIKSVITIKSNSSSLNVDSFYIFKRTLSNIFVGDLIIVYNNSIVILFNKEHANLLEGYKDNFIKILNTYSSRAFISLPFSKLSEFEKHYAQTQYCIRMSEELDIDEIIVKYEDYIVQHMLLHFNEVFSIYDLIHPSVKFLMKFDEKKNSQLLDTLFCVLKNSNNITLAAKELNIHYNTLKYRINNIVELTNIDLRDNETIFSLMISRKILELIDKANGSIQYS